MLISYEFGELHVTRGDIWLYITRWKASLKTTQKKQTELDSKRVWFCSPGAPFPLDLFLHFWDLCLFSPLLMSLILFSDDFLWHRQLNKTRACIDKTTFCLSFLVLQIRGPNSFRTQVWFKIVSETSFCVRRGHRMEPPCACSVPLCSGITSPNLEPKSKGCWDAAPLRPHRPKLRVLWGNTSEQNLTFWSSRTLRTKAHQPRV